MYRKYSYEEKLSVVEGYLNGAFSLGEKAHEFGYKAIPGCLNDGYVSIRSKELKDFYL